MKFSVIILLILSAIGLLINLHRDFYGIERKAPGGFSGAIGSLIATTLVLVLYWQAGLFD